MGPTRSFVPLGEIMTPAIDPHRLDPEAAYPNIGIYSFGRGIFWKPPIVGSTSSASTLYRVRAGQFIYSRLFAFEGAYGIVPAEADGAFVSNEFPTFDIDQHRADPDYLGWFFRVPAVWRALAEKSVGMGDRRKRVKPETVLAHRIALPPIQEQLRLAAQIDRMAVLVDEARCLLQQARDEALRVCRALLYGRGRAVPPLVQVGELARQRPTDVDVSPDEEYHFAGVYSFGRGVFPGEKKKGAEFAYKELTRLRRGDFTYPKLMAWEGALGIVPTECDGLVVSPEFPVFELDDDRVLPDVLDVYFRDPMIWPSLKGDSPGTNVRRRRLNPSTFLALKIPLPSMGDQRHLAGVRAQLTDAARARAGSLDELDDLVGCMLRRVFGDAQDQPAPTEDRTAA